MTDTQIIALVSALLPSLIALATYLGNVLLTRLPKNRQTQLTAIATDDERVAAGARPTAPLRELILHAIQAAGFAQG